MEGLGRHVEIWVLTGVRFKGRRWGVRNWKPGEVAINSNGEA